MTRQPLAAALRLVVILDTGVAREVKADLETLARHAAQGGATMLQVRAKRESAGDLADLTRRVIAAAAGLPVIVNDRLDVAVAAGAPAAPGQAAAFADGGHVRARIEASGDHAAARHPVE